MLFPGRQGASMYPSETAGRLPDQVRWFSDAGKQGECGECGEGGWD